MSGERTAPELEAGPTSRVADGGAAGRDGPVLAADRIAVRIGRVVALAGVSLDVHAGEVLCLLGDNGAGKSTLISVLSGVRTPTAGRILVDGAPIRLRSPRDARGRGIATVFQDLAVLPLMSVWRNFVLGAEPTRGWGPLRWLDARECRRRTVEWLATVGIRIDDPDRVVGTLSGGERQALAIARAVHSGARVLILDEPTAALGVAQAERLLALVRTVRDRGVAVILITHNPRDALSVGDRFVVLRRGTVVAELVGDQATLAVLLELMSGSVTETALSDRAGAPRSTV